jgi:hypothetical protein
LMRCCFLVLLVAEESEVSEATDCGSELDAENNRNGK